MPGRPRWGRLRTAMRRAVVTPTFAAGLGVVIAAVLAYPMGKVVFRYIEPGNGQPCPVSGCAPSHVKGAGTLASASPGQPLVTAGPHAAGPEAGEGTLRAGVKTSPRPVAGQPLLSYQTTRRWHGGFVGQITVSFPTGHAPGHWWLRFSYPSQQIHHVWSHTWRMSVRTGHSVVVVSPAGAAPGTGRTGDPVWFGVSGQAGEPPVCFFDRVACLFTPAPRVGTGHHGGWGRGGPGQHHGAGSHGDGYPGTTRHHAGPAPTGSGRQHRGAWHHRWQHHRHDWQYWWQYWHHRQAW